MKGGFKYQISETHYARIMKRFGKGTFLPIPSQKRNICVTDALMAVLWYTDGLRDRLWETYIHNKVIDTDCDKRIATMDNDELATCFFQLSGARVANLLNIPPLRAEPTRPLLLRAPSAGLEEFLPDGTPIPPEDPAVGEVCSMIYHAFRRRIQGLNVSEDITRLEDFTIKEDEIRPLLRRAIDVADIEGTIEITERGEEPPEGSQLLAVYTVLNTGSLTYHLVALCKINGQWHFLDNNVGYSLPFLEEADNDERVRAMRLHEELYCVGGELFYTLYDHSRPYPPVSKTGVQKIQNADSQIFWTEDPHKLQRFYVYTTTPLPAPAAQPRHMSNPMFDELEAKRNEYPDKLEILEGPYAEDSPYDVDTTLETGIYTIMSDRDFLDGLRLRRKSETNDDETLYILNGSEMEEVEEEEVDPVKLHSNMVDELISRGYTKSEAETGVDNADTIEGAIRVIESIRQRKSQGGRRKTYRVEIMKQRRNTYRRHRKQKGAARFRFNIDRDVLPKLNNPNIGAIAIPSQKEAICITDAFQGFLWYADEIRNTMWNSLKSESGDPRDIDIETRTLDDKLPQFRNRIIAEIQKIRDNGWNTPDVRQLRLELIKNWMTTTGARVGGILSTHAVAPPAERPVLARQPSQGQDECVGGVCSVGSQCAKWYHLYNTLRYGTDGTIGVINAEAPPYNDPVTGESPPGETRRARAIRQTNELRSEREELWGNTGSVLNMTNDIFEIANLSGYEADYDLPNGATPLAMYIRTQRVFGSGPRQGQFDPTSGHLSAIVKLNGRWFYFDNEVGVAEPLLIQDWDQIDSRQPFRVDYTQRVENQEIRIYQELKKDLPYSPIQRMLRRRPYDPETPIVESRNYFRETTEDRIYVYRRAGRDAPAPTVTVPTPAPTSTSTVSSPMEDAVTSTSTTTVPTSAPVFAPTTPTFPTAARPAPTTVTVPTAARPAPTTVTVPTSAPTTVTVPTPPPTTVTVPTPAPASAPAPTGPDERPQAPEGMVTGVVMFANNETYGNQEVYAFIQTTPDLIFETTINGILTTVRLGKIELLNGSVGILWYPFRDPYNEDNYNIRVYDDEHRLVPGKVYFPNATITTDLRNRENVIAVSIDGDRFFVLYRMNGQHTFAIPTTDINLLDLFLTYQGEDIQVQTSKKQPPPLPTVTAADDPYASASLNIQLAEDRTQQAEVQAEEEAIRTAGPRRVDIRKLEQPIQKAQPRQKTTAELGQEELIRLRQKGEEQKRQIQERLAAEDIQMRTEPFTYDAEAEQTQQPEKATPVVRFNSVLREGRQAVSVSVVEYLTDGTIKLITESGQVIYVRDVPASFLGAESTKFAPTLKEGFQSPRPVYIVTKEVEEKAKRQAEEATRQAAEAKLEAPFDDERRQERETKRTAKEKLLVEYPDILETKPQDNRRAGKPSVRASQDNVKIQQTWSIRYPYSTYAVTYPNGNTIYIQRLNTGTGTHIARLANGETFEARIRNIGYGGKRKTYRKGKGRAKKTRKH